jgi:hypothetical protein
VKELTADLSVLVPTLPPFTGSIHDIENLAFAERDLVGIIGGRVVGVHCPEKPSQMSSRIPDTRKGTYFARKLYCPSLARDCCAGIEETGIPNPLGTPVLATPGPEYSRSLVVTFTGVPCTGA